MALSTYAELQTAVATWLARSDLTTTIPDLILLGEKKIFREVRAYEMETALNVTIASGVAAIPTDYLSLKFARIAGTQAKALGRSTASVIYTKYPLRSSDGKPSLIAREGANFIFGPYPDSNYTINGIYYAELTSIQTSANALFLANPDLYLFAALSEAKAFVQDDKRIQTWESKYQQIKQLVDSSESREYSSGGGLAVSAA